MKLFHRIGNGGEDSAAVRGFLVAKDLTEIVDFCNVAYESHQRDLLTATGGDAVPALVIDGQAPKIGKDAILNYLATLSKN